MNSGIKIGLGIGAGVLAAGGIYAALQRFDRPGAELKIGDNRAGQSLTPLHAASHAPVPTDAGALDGASLIASLGSAMYPDYPGFPGYAYTPPTKDEAYPETPDGVIPPTVDWEGVWDGPFAPGADRPNMAGDPNFTPDMSEEAYPDVP